jgi:LPLT family lysophospholipid transporter-like MFS transporter
MKDTSRNYPLLLVSQFLGAFGDNFLLAAILAPLTFAQTSGAITVGRVNELNALYTLVFFLPFIVLAPVAGYLNDRHPKTTWLAGGNLFKLLGTLVGLVGVLRHGVLGGGDLPWQVAGYAVVGLGACFYSPAKYGILPEIVARERLVKANGTVEMLTLVAIVGGLGVGAIAYDRTRSLPLCYGGAALWYLLALACNAGMTRTPSNAAARFRASFGEFAADLVRFLRHPRLLRILLGCGVFWFAGSALRNNLQAWGLVVFAEAGVPKEKINNETLVLLKVGMVLGIVIGSFLAGLWHRVSELHWSRRYAFLMAASVALLGVLGGRWGLAVVVVALVLAGGFAGLLIVPLNAALQSETDPKRLGKTIAIQNFVDYVAMAAGAGFLAVLTHAGLGPNAVFLALAAAIVALAVALTFGRNLRSAPSREGQP